MGHRVLVAYDRDGYDLHYAHWGVAPDDITPETPFGGTLSEEWARERAEDLLDAMGGHLTEDHRTAVDPDPLATGLSFPEVCEYVDPLEYEALYVVTPDFTVRTYLAFALRWGTDDPLGALVGYEDVVDASYLRGWLAGARAVRNSSAENGGGNDSVVRALRWLDPDRGTVVSLDPGERSGRQTEREN
jgi:hypothetical protein